MKIKKIGLRNIKSFGNNKQYIEFNDNAQLILLTGRNGSGKSTILDAIDLTLYNKVRGKNKKNIALSSVINRINGELDTDIEFINNQNQNIFISKKINPNSFKISINNIDQTDKFNILSEEDKEKILDFNYDSFKSFISMSINDFNNFISLDETDKRNLINKLFNLGKIDSYLSIISEIINNNNIKINDNKNKLNLNLNLISNYEKSNNNIKTQKLNSITTDGIKYSTEFKQFKAKIEELLPDLTTYQNQISELKMSLTELKNTKFNIESDIKINNKQISLYEQNKCPYCNSELKKSDNSNYNELLTEQTNLRFKLEKLNTDINELNSKGKNIVIKYNELNDKKINYEKSLKELQLNLELLKKEYLYLTADKNNDNIDINNLKNENEKISEQNEFLINENNEYKKLIEILNCKDGIRQQIITNLLSPINEYIEDHLNFLNFKYTVKLDNNFDAKIYERKYNNIHSETLSTGEMKIINICIALAYIKMINKMRNINILFLDELFATIDLENVDLILKLIKKISLELNLNIIIIHHEITDVNMDTFDRIIKVTNNMFTKIEDINLK
jgi:DNA repair exonuclease SbcCD ATPase subunit